MKTKKAASGRRTPKDLTLPEDVRLMERRTNVAAHQKRRRGPVAFQDLKGHFVDALTGQRFDAKLHCYTLLFGSRFNWRHDSRAIPFAHALFGAVRAQG